MKESAYVCISEYNYTKLEVFISIYSLFPILIILCSVTTSTVVKAEIFGDFMGVTACIECHTELVDGWNTTPHARAFEDLKTQGSESQSNPGCFKCHVVGYEQDGGYIDMDLTPELINVPCESCHGQGRAHIESDGDPELIISTPEEKSCRVCHTEGQDKNFDYKTKSRLVHGKRTKESE